MIDQVRVVLRRTLVGECSNVNLSHLQGDCVLSVDCNLFLVDDSIGQLNCVVSGCEDL